MDTLAGIGIRPKLPALDAVGGPLLPAIDGAESSTLIDDANGVAAALERYRAARSAADRAPVHQPIANATRTSSTFGNRKDPFTGRLAFHSGLDYAAPHGSKVLSAGAGTVTFVGQMSGYGNVVEVTHGNGLVTRYGHLSAFLAKEGQKVTDRHADRARRVHRSLHRVRTSISKSAAATTPSIRPGISRPAASSPRSARAKCQIRRLNEVSEWFKCIMPLA